MSWEKVYTPAWELWNAVRQPHSLKVGAVLDTRSLPRRGISEESKPMLASLETVALLGSWFKTLGYHSRLLS